ncbi:phage major capsid protein [Acinetobacter sp. 187]|uniref:phage major capsid protein n=1 Tax=Acinetobacter lanii TaxID=2715163 RepID=UPI0014096A1E|nr:phage major capsid protein [Acinetobacter lanii]NHC02334.1 phage major capsid protein [Acinetobacter lanii]
MLKAQLAKVKATIADKQKAMQALHQAAHEKGVTLSAEQNTQYEGLEKQVEQLEKEAGRIEKLIADTEKAQASGLTPVNGQTAQEAQDTAEGKKEVPRVQVEPTLAKGVGFAMAVKATALAGKSIAKGQSADALSILKHWGAPQNVQDILIAKGVGTTTDQNFASALVNQKVLENEFIELLRPKTMLGRISGFRNVPFNVKIPLQTGSSTVAWVGEGQNKPVTNPTFGTVTLGKHKVAGIVVMTDELIADSSPSAVNLVRDDLLAAMAQHADSAFIDPTKSAVDGVSPASITNGLVADDIIASTGTTAAQYEADLKAALGRFIEAGLSLDGAYWLMSETQAVELALLRDALGGTYFKGMDLGGEMRLLNLPVITSQNAGSQIVLLKPSEILLADEGGVDFAMSSEASIQIGVDGDGKPVMVNLFQQDMTAVRAEQFKTWKKIRNLGVVRITYS